MSIDRPEEVKSSSDDQIRPDSIVSSMSMMDPNNNNNNNNDNMETNLSLVVLDEPIVHDVHHHDNSNPNEEDGFGFAAPPPPAEEGLLALNENTAATAASLLPPMAPEPQHPQQQQQHPELMAAEAEEKKAEESPTNNVATANGQNSPPRKHPPETTTTTTNSKRGEAEAAANSPKRRRLNQSAAATGENSSSHANNNQKGEPDPPTPLGNETASPENRKEKPSSSPSSQQQQQQPLQDAKQPQKLKQTVSPIVDHRIPKIPQLREDVEKLRTTSSRGRRRSNSSSSAALAEPTTHPRVHHISLLEHIWVALLGLAVLEGPKFKDLDATIEKLVANHYVSREDISSDTLWTFLMGDRQKMLTDKMIKTISEPWEHWLETKTAKDAVDFAVKNPKTYSSLEIQKTDKVDPEQNAKKWHQQAVDHLPLWDREDCRMANCTNKSESVWYTSERPWDTWPMCQNCEDAEFNAPDEDAEEVQQAKEIHKRRSARLLGEPNDKAEQQDDDTTSGSQKPNKSSQDDNNNNKKNNHKNNKSSRNHRPAQSKRGGKLLSDEDWEEICRIFINEWEGSQRDFLRSDASGDNVDLDQGSEKTFSLKLKKYREGHPTSSKSPKRGARPPAKPSKAAKETAATEHEKPKAPKRGRQSISNDEAEAEEDGEEEEETPKTPKRGRRSEAKDTETEGAVKLPRRGKMSEYDFNRSLKTEHWLELCRIFQQEYEGDTQVGFLRSEKSGDVSYDPYTQRKFSEHMKIYKQKLAEPNNKVSTKAGESHGNRHKRSMKNRTSKAKEDANEGKAKGGQSKAIKGDSKDGEGKNKTSKAREESGEAKPRARPSKAKEDANEDEGLISREPQSPNGRLERLNNRQSRADKQNKDPKNIGEAASLEIVRKSRARSDEANVSDKKKDTPPSKETDQDGSESEHEQKRPARASSESSKDALNHNTRSRAEKTVDVSNADANGTAVGESREDPQEPQAMEISERSDGPAEKEEEQEEEATLEIPSELGQRVAALSKTSRRDHLALLLQSVNEALDNSSDLSSDLMKLLILHDFFTKTMKLITAHKKSSPIVEHCMSLLIKFAEWNLDKNGMARTMVDGGIIEPLLQAMHCHPSSLEVKKKGCTVLLRLMKVLNEAERSDLCKQSAPIMIQVLDSQDLLASEEMIVNAGAILWQCTSDEQGRRSLINANSATSLTNAMLNCTFAKYKEAFMALYVRMMQDHSKSLFQHVPGDCPFVA